MKPALVSWFAEAPLPGIVPDPAIVLGGTSLLREFMRFVASVPAGGRLSIAAPYVGGGIVSTIRAWESMPHELIDVFAVTHRPADAEMAWGEIGALPWHSLVIRVYPRLHAKMYAFLAPTDGGACLVGSHNLSRRGAERNDEAGALMLSRHDPDILRLIQACDDRVRWLAAKGEPFMDTLCWPTASDTSRRRTA
jgi:hypothetical protein